MPNSAPFWEERINQISLSKGDDSYISSRTLTIGQLFLAIDGLLVGQLFTLSCQLHTARFPSPHVAVCV